MDTSGTFSPSVEVGIGMGYVRPDLTELVLPTVAALGAEVVRVRLTEVRNDVVHGELELSTGARVDARASDAVVLALRADGSVGFSGLTAGLGLAGARAIVEGTV